jgi:hypothetical protein
VGRVDFLDVCWPAREVLGGRLVASIRIQTRNDAGGLDNLNPQLWWIELDSDARSIVAAGRLTDPAGEGPERHPAILRRWDGTSVAIYLSYEKNAALARLLAAPLDRMEAGGLPALELDRTRTRVLAEGCLASTPVPSSDGLHISVVQACPETGKPEVRRVGADPGEGAARVVVSWNSPERPQARPDWLGWSK